MRDVGTHDGVATRNPARVDFPGLDGLRVVGALAVLTTHVAFQTGESFRHGVVGTLLARLDVGVAIFFVLSGFLLSRPWWVRAELGEAPPRIASYARKRVWRIFPVYLAAVVAALTVMSENDGAGLRTWFSSLTMVNTYVATELPHGLTQMWSLSVEVAFYAVLPALMWLTLGRPARIGRRSGGVLLGLLAVTLGWVIWAAPALGDERAWSPALWLPGYLSWFAAGLWLAREHVLASAGRPTRLGRVVAAAAAQPGTAWVMALGLMLIAATPLAGPVALEQATTAAAVFKNLAYALIGLLLVATGVWSDARGAFRRVFDTRIVRHLGHVSYSVFCLHLVVLAVVQDRMDYQLFSGDFLHIWSVTIAGTLVVSEVVYWGLERPAMRFATPSKGTTAQQPTPTQAATTK